MLRIASAMLFGAVVLYAWSAAYWMTIGRQAVGVIPDETPVTSAIREHVPGHGAFFFPGLPPGEVTAAQLRDFEERHRRGPVGMLVVNQAGGGESLETMSLVRGFALALLTAALLTLLVRAAAPSAGFAGRWCVALIAGLAAAVGTHGLQWNQFHFPGRYSAYLVADVAGSWALAGLAIAALLPRRLPPASR
jgi:hypothetical protein